MSRNPSGPGFQRRPRIADQMTDDLLACVDRALAAERAGDVAAALEWHQAVPMFQRGRHRLLMDRLLQLGDDLPEWVWARWTVYQAIRCEDGETGRSGRRLLRSMAVLHDDLMADCYQRGGDPVAVVARLLGESWLFHQSMAYEVDAVSSFLDEFATERLAEHSELVRRWVGARLGGYQLGDSLDGVRLQLRPAGEEAWTEVLDLGARSCAPRHGFVLGRLVPSGIGEGLMFDMPPLSVPEPIAREVMSARGGGWEVLVRVVGSGRLRSEQLMREDYELTGDVPELAMIRFGTEPRELDRVMIQLREGRDESSRAAYRILSRARGGDVAPADHAYVAAAAQFPRAFQDARRRLTRAGDRDVWTGWAERTVEPARRRLSALAEACR